VLAVEAGSVEVEAVDEDAAGGSDEPAELGTATIVDGGVAGSSTLSVDPFDEHDESTAARNNAASRHVTIGPFRLADKVVDHIFDRAGLRE